MSRSPAVSFSLSANVYGSSAVSVGQFLLPDANGNYVPATAANRTAIGRRSEAAALSAWSSSQNGTVSLQEAGTLDAAVSLLGVGVASWVRCSATGFAERFTPVNAGTSDVIGWCETDGRMHLLFGVLTETMLVGGGGSSFTPPTGNGLVTVTAGVLNAASTANVAYDGTGLAINASGYLSIGGGTLPANALIRMPYLGATTTNVLSVKSSGATDAPLVMVGPGNLNSWGNPGFNYGVMGAAGTFTFSGGFTWTCGGTLSITAGGAATQALYSDGGSVGLGCNVSGTSSHINAYVYASSRITLGINASHLVIDGTVASSPVQICSPMAGNVAGTASQPLRSRKATILPTATNAVTLTQDQYACPMLLFKTGGGVTAAVTVTMPNVDGEFHIVKNRCGFNVVIGGVTIATATDAHISYDSDAAAWGRCA